MEIEHYKEVATADEAEEKEEQASVDVLKQQLADASSRLGAAGRKLEEKRQQRTAQKARVQSLETKYRLMQVASDRKAIDIAAAAIADGTLQLNKRMPEGLLRQITSEQKKHFRRLLPDVRLVSYRSVARPALCS